MRVAGEIDFVPWQGGLFTYSPLGRRSRTASGTLTIVPELRSYRYEAWGEGVAMERMR